MKSETTVDISKHKDLKEFVTQVRNQKEDAEVIQGLIIPKANREKGRGWLPEGGYQSLGLWRGVSRDWCWVPEKLRGLCADPECTQTTGEGVNFDGCSQPHGGCSVDP